MPNNSQSEPRVPIPLLPYITPFPTGDRDSRTSKLRRADILKSGEESVCGAQWIKRPRDMRRLPKESHQLTPSRMIVDLQKWFLLSGSLSVTRSGRKRETFHGFDNIQLSLLIT